jgi:hypothetical protein
MAKNSRSQKHWAMPISEVGLPYLLRTLGGWCTLRCRQRYGKCKRISPLRQSIEN